MHRWAPWAILIGVLTACLARSAQGTNPPAQYVPSVPTYSAQYRDQDPIWREMLAEMKTHRKLTEKLVLLLERQQAANIPVVPLPANLKEFFTWRCAACHNEALVEKLPPTDKRIVLVLKDGTVPPLSLGEKRFVTREVQAGRMPLDPKTSEPHSLSDAEKKLLPELLSKHLP